RDTTKKYAIIPGYDHYQVDEAPYGYWGYGETGIDGMNIGGWMNLGRDETKNSTVILKADYTNQLKTNHQMKTGFGAAFNSFKIRSFTENPGMSTWNRSMVYDVAPFRIYAYMQDKVEYKGFIANLGLRGDISNGNTEVYSLDMYDDSFKQGLGNEIESTADTKKAKPNYALSPRLGISHPITERSKLYFNYGHFYSEPSSSYRFRLQRESNGLVTHVGDPNMDFEKTVAYEVGFSTNPFGNYLVNLALFYKDITNQPGWVYYQNMNGTVQVNRIENNNYEDIRGMEFTLKKNVGLWITGMVNYTYLVQSSGYFGLLRQFQDPNMQRDYESLNQYQSKPRPRPYLRAVINLQSPSNFGPRFMKNHILGEWTSSLIITQKAGAYETYNPQNIPGVADNVQWKDSYSTNLRVSKRLRWKQGYMDLIVDVQNLFNHQFLSYAGFADYYDYIDYLESLRFPWEDGKEKGNDRIGEYRDWSIPYQPYEPDDWENPTPSDKNILDSKAYIDMPNIRAVSFLDPRDIYFGISVHF
ncbi:MAG TPA: TonB-dependent receptor, partial [Candidatus Marinimicrobia bacterium]|nr:TonB-dependent receptor [Candidatus Neomarinimicrobiota bacterium]